MTKHYMDLIDSVPLPRMALIRQHFEAHEVNNVDTVLREAMPQECLERVLPGMRIALTVGSRGIASLVPLVRSIVALLVERGAEPFIVPAMGSHGGATAQGQEAILASLGITAQSVACPISSSMETVELACLSNGMSVQIDRTAHEADGIVVFNRIKAHSAFRAAHESGLVKMIAIGLGNQSGAESCHAWGFSYMGDLIAQMATMKIARSRILFGIGSIENAYDRLTKIVVLPSERIVDEEPTHLREAMRQMPRLPLGKADTLLAEGNLDVLILDQIGKEFSGSGMDPNITGSTTTPALTGGPTISRIVALDVSDKSDGNAIGIGLADVTTERLLSRFKRETAYPNALTSGILKSISLPPAMPTERAAIQAAIKTCLSHTPNALRIMRIPNTLHLEYIYVSEALIHELALRPNVELLSSPSPMRFDEYGNCADKWFS